MFTIKTATGKEFDSDYAVENPQVKLAFVTILGHNKEEVQKILKNKAEFPLDCFPQYGTLADILEITDGVKLILEP